MKLGNNQYNEFLKRNYLSEELLCSFLTERVKCLWRFSFEFTDFSFVLFAGGNISWEKQGS